MADRKVVSSRARDDVVVLPVNRQSTDVGRYIPTVDKADFLIPEEPGLRDYWHIIWRHRMAVWLVFALVVALVLIASLLATPIYRASLTLKIERETPKILKYQDIAPVESAFDKDFYQTQYELLKSRTLVNRVIDQLDLESNPVFTREATSGGAFAWLGAFFGNDDKALDENGRHHRLMEHFLDALTVEPVKRSRLVKVHYDSPDRVLAARVANTLVENFISMNLERRFEASSYAKSFLENRLRQVKSKLEESEKKLVHFARDQEIVNVDESRSVDGEKLQEMNIALVQAEKERIEAEARYRAMLAGNGADPSGVLDSPVIQQLKQTQANLEADYQDKLTVYKPAYPLMRQIKGQIEEIRAQINRETGAIVSTLKMKFAEAKQKERLLGTELVALKDKVLAVQDRSIQYNILKREVDTNRELYDGLLQRLKEVGVGAGATTNNVSVIDQAEAPVEKFRPQVALNAMLAAIIGLFLGVGCAFLFEHLDDTLKSPEDLEQRFDLPVLGVIPVARAGFSHTNEGGYIGILSHREPTSGFAEAYRSVRTAFLFSTASGAPRTLLFTSAGPGEGKTTSAVNVAITFTQTGNRVLIIDADLRKPSLHRIMDVDNCVGLTNYLAGDARPADISKPTAIDDLYLIPCGPLPPNPAELLSSEKMFSLLALAQDKFDYVVVDGPPILGLADAVILSNMVSATAVVVEAGNARRTQLEDALKRLRVAKASVVGALLTKLRHKDAGYGYKNSYYYYYNDGRNSKRLPT